MDPHLLSDVKAAENCKLVAYLDTKGYWTVGWGHKLPLGRNWTGHTVTQDEADQLLAADLANAQREAQGLPEWSALETVCRQNAISELVFNMGLSKWQGFHKTRQALAERDWPTAHNELLNSEWAPEVGHERSTRLANQLLKGEYS